MKKNKFVLLITILLLVFSACNNAVYKESFEIPNSIWDMNNVLQYKADIQEIDDNYNIYLDIKHTRKYPAQNLWLFIKTTAPNGVYQQDTIECFLANEEYKWNGKGSGDKWKVKIPFKGDIKFPAKGMYIFEIQHGMRREKLPEVMEVGVVIEKMK